MTLQEDITAIEEEITSTKYNKATQHHIGKLKAKLARLREEAVARASGPKGGGYAVRKAGHATVALVGLPSVGKSTLLNGLTAAQSEIAAYEFTTLDVVPGMLAYRGANIQLLDLPGLIAGASRGSGRGREVLSVVRSADLVLLLVDAARPHLETVVRELEGAGLRLNGRQPNGRITRTGLGGITVVSPVAQELEEETIKVMLREYGLVNAEVVLRERFNADKLVDLLADNRIYTSALACITKTDLVPEAKLARAREICRDYHTVEIAATRGRGLSELKEAIYQALDFVAIYMKPQGQPADLDEPLIVRRGTRIRHVCRELHRDFERRFRYAQIWGPSARFPGQTVGLDHEVQESDLVTLVVQK